MHTDLFLKTTMRIIQPYMHDVHDRYLRKQSSEHPFTFEELQGVMRSYEGNGYLDRSRGPIGAKAAAVRAPLLCVSPLHTKTHTINNASFVVVLGHSSAL
jgi:hypothetical protein